MVAWAMALWREPVHERRSAAIEFFIRKAIGWVLREISRRDPGWVAAFTEHHISAMSGVTFREAIRRLPPDEAQRLTSLR